MSAQWLKKLRTARPDLAAVADAQPRRAEESAGEKTSSSSSSSSSEESSDTEPDTDPAFVDANAAAMKLNRLFLGGGKAGGVVGDETLLEMARERKERAENEPASPKKKRTK